MNKFIIPIIFLLVSALTAPVAFGGEYGPMPNSSFFYGVSETPAVNGPDEALQKAAPEDMGHSKADRQMLSPDHFFGYASPEVGQSVNHEFTGDAAGPEYAAQKTDNAMSPARFFGYGDPADRQSRCPSC